MVSGFSEHAGIVTETQRCNLLPIFAQLPKMPVAVKAFLTMQILCTALRSLLELQVKDSVLNYITVLKVF